MKHLELYIIFNSWHQPLTAISALIGLIMLQASYFLSFRFRGARLPPRNMHSLGVLVIELKRHAHHHAAIHAVVFRQITGICYG